MTTSGRPGPDHPSLEVAAPRVGRWHAVQTDKSGATGCVLR